METPGEVTAAAAPCFLIAVDPVARGLYAEIAVPGGARGLYAEIAVPGGARGDSGTDLRFAEEAEIPPMNATLGLPVVVDLKIRARCIVDGAYVPFQIVPRSSISCTTLSLANSVGIIDAGYQGPLKIALRNNSLGKSWFIHRNDALFQLVRPDLAPARLVVVGHDHPAFAGRIREHWRRRRKITALRRLLFCAGEGRRCAGEGRRCAGESLTAAPP